MESVVILVIFILSVRLFVYWYNTRRTRDKAPNEDHSQYLERVFGVSREELNQPRVNSKMDLNGFWDIIEKSRLSAKDVVGQANILRDELRKLTTTEIIEFDNRFKDLRNKAHRWDLWGAIYLLNGGCSDDSFDYFKEWLIGQGKNKFNKAVKDPESIVEFVDVNDEWEGLGYCANEVYTERTNKKFMPGNAKFKEVPTGKEWIEDDLPKTFPSIWNSVNKTTHNKS